MKIKALCLFSQNIKHIIKPFQNGEVSDNNLMGWNYMEKFNISVNYFGINYKLNNESRFKKNYNFFINQIKDLVVIFRIRKYDLVFLSHSLKIVFLVKNLFHIKKTKVFFYNVNLRSIIKNNKRKKFKYWVINRVVKKIDAIICPSISQLENLISEGYDVEKLFFLPTGVDINFLNNKQKSVERMSEKFILSVGKDSGRDYRTLIEAVKDLNIKVRIITKIDNIASDIVIPQNVQIDFLPYNELLKLYHNCLFVVVPTINEDQEVYQSDCSGHTVILEAMACGKAIIATKRSTVSHLIEDNKNGILVEPENIEVLKKAIQILLNDENLCYNMGKLSVEKVKEFSTKNFAEKLNIIIKTVIK